MEEVGSMADDGKCSKFDNKERGMVIEDFQLAGPAACRSKIEDIDYSEPQT